MLRLACDGGVRRRLAEEGTRIVATKTHDAWASDFEAFVQHVFALPPRRTIAAMAVRGLGSLLLHLPGQPGAAAAPYVAGKD